MGGLEDVKKSDMALVPATIGDFPDFALISRGLSQLPSEVSRSYRWRMTTLETDEAPKSDRDPENPAPSGLHRSIVNRKIAGVAGGIGERFDIDPNFVRAGFVVLTALWGLGVAIYLAMWALVPQSGGSQVEDSTWRRIADVQHLSWLRTVLFVLVFAVGMFFAVELVSRPNIGGVVSLIWVVFLVGLAVISLRMPTSRVTFGRLAGAAVVVVFGLAITASGAVLAYLAMTGVPIAGGVGQRIYQPTSANEVLGSYRLAFGAMTVDLRAVAFGHRHMSVSASVAIGRLVIEVPPGAVVDLTAQDGTSSISYPQGPQQFYASASSTPAAPHLDLTVRTGIGVVVLERGLPGQSFF